MKRWHLTVFVLVLISALFGVAQFQPPPSGGGGSMVYPAAGVANSTGTAWGTSYTVGAAASNLPQLDGSALLPASTIPLPGVATLGGVFRKNCASGSPHTLIVSINADGSSTCENPAQLNGLAIPTSSAYVGTNSSGQIIPAATPGGGGSNVTSGPYSSLPGTCAHSSTASDLYYTEDSYFTFICTATNTFTAFADGKKLTLPTAASTWTAINGASGVAAKSDSNGAVLWATAAGVNGWEAIVKAVPSAPYTKIIAVRIQTLVGNNSGALGGGETTSCGVGWTSGTATSSAMQLTRIYHTNASLFPAIESVSWTNFTFTGAAVQKTSSVPIGLDSANNITWFKLVDDNTNRSTFISNDGVKYIPIQPAAARTSPFTPTNYGVFCSQAAASVAQPWAIAILSDN